MKTIHRSMIIAAVALMAGFQSGAMASDKSLGDGNTNWEEHQRSIKTRAEVVADLNQAREQGRLWDGNDNTYPVAAMAQSSRSRADVRHDAEHAQQSGNRITNHNYGGNQ